MQKGISSLTKAETAAGWIWLPCYLFFLPLALQYANLKFSWGLTDLTLSLLSLGINLAAVLLIFSRYLLRTLPGRGLWNGILALALGAAVCCGGTWLLGVLTQKLQLSLPQYNNDTVLALIAQNRTLMAVVCVTAVPLIEETLIRGLVFGSLRRISGFGAAVISTLLFLLMHVWTYFGRCPTGAVLLSALRYLPAAAGLCLTAAVSDTVWSSVLLHAMINAVTFGIIKIF